jgi:hypothetical protein
LAATLQEQWFLDLSSLLKAFSQHFLSPSFQLGKENLDQKKRAWPKAFFFYQVFFCRPEGEGKEKLGPARFELAISGCLLALAVVSMPLAVI